VPLVSVLFEKLVGRVASWSGEAAAGVADAADEVPLEAPDRLAGALAFAAPTGDVVASLGVAAGPGDDHAASRRVDLAVAALVEPVALRVARAGWDRRNAGGAGELGGRDEALGAGDLADELGGDQRPEAGLVEQLHHRHRNVTSRPRTAAAASWSPAAWTAGQAGADQRTPDLSSVVQEIINRPGWASGNALALIITGSGRRTAVAHNGSATTAPLRYIEYQ
jgi:hypothetical protein